jgi:hypothetical protein
MIEGKGDQAAEQQRDADCSDQQKTSRSAIKAIHEKPSVRADDADKPFRDLAAGEIKIREFLLTSFTKMDRSDASTVVGHFRCGTDCAALGGSFAGIDPHRGNL